MTAKDFSIKSGLEVAANVSIGGEISNVTAVNFYVEHNDGQPPEGHLCWNAEDGTLNLGMAGSNVVLQTGQETLAYVKNNTANTILNGSTVAHISAQNGRLIVEPYIADGTFLPEEFLGVATEDIAPSAIGYVTTYGYVRNFDTSAFTVGDIVYASTSVPGGLTTEAPISPNVKVVVGSVSSSAANGSIFVDRVVSPLASDVSYNNTTSNLVATNLQAAVDELQLTKASVELLTSSINLYPTTAASNVTNYVRMVDSTTDADYNTTAVDVGTGTINTTDQLVSNLIADSGLFIGNPGVLNITTIGNIAKTAGNKNDYAEFFFRLYKRNAAGAEELLGTSSTTGPVNPDTLNLYQQFSASAILNNGEFLSTDRLVIKYFANAIEGTAAQYNFQFGGSSPVRTLVPVPVSVIPSGDASEILVDTSTFNGLLSGADSTVQLALETLDDHSHTTDNITEGSNLYYTIPRANSAIDARVTNAFINALTIDADTLSGQPGSYYTGYTDTAIANLVDSSPAALDTLNELAAALGDDPNFATTVSTQIGLKLDSASFTGANILANLVSVDGTGSGLDADLLDGQQGSYYLDYNNFTNTPSIPQLGIDFDPVGTDNSTDVTLVGSYDYLTIAGQQITLNQIDYTTDISNLPTLYTTANANVDIDARVTTSYITNLGALMDSELANISAVKSLNQGVSTTDNPTFDGITVTQNISVSGLVDGRDIAADGTKLDSIEASADVTDADNVNPLIDAHLNSNTATTNQVLSWSGTDYSWVDAASGGTASGGTTWSLKTADYTAINGDGIIADTTAGTFTITLPASPTTGDNIIIADSGNWAINNLIVARNGSTIEDITEDLILDIGALQVHLIYSGTTWEVYAITGPAIGVTDDTTTNETKYITWNDTASGEYNPKTSSTKLTFNPFSGTLTSTDYNSLSDARLKQDIKNIDIDYNIFNSIRPVTFSWKDTNKTAYGFIAQELEQIMPELVNTSDNGYKSVGYTQLIPYLVAIIKELKQEVENIKETVNDNT